jgi:succinyl-CoA synthetase beta subunit
MLLLEYEAKDILRKAPLPIPSQILLHPDSHPDIAVPIVLKSQVPVGGRGKLGGVVIVKDPAKIQPTIDRLFSLNIKGFTPHTVLAEEEIVVKKEHYLSLLVDRGSQTIRLVSRKSGGIDVESNSDTLFNEPVDASTIGASAIRLATHLGYTPDFVTPFITTMFDTFVTNDMLLLEINPLMVTHDDQLVCGDCKIELDDAALFRHPEWQFETMPGSANFVTLDQDGTVATIANGAGLAMATVDAVRAKDMQPANFLDIGGGANAESVLAAFKQINDLPEIKAIVINIFAGITRCDEVARAIIAARDQLPHLPPLCIRLAGTHFQEAVALLATQNIPTLGTLDECLNTAKEIVYA